MNSAGRIHKILSFFQGNNKTLKELIATEYLININDRIENLNFLIHINQEVNQFEKDLIAINKKDKYLADLNTIKNIFNIRAVETAISNIINQTELGKIIDRLEVLEDLFESNKISENTIEEDKINSLINELDEIIKKIEDINEDNKYFIIIKILNEIKLLLKMYKVNGIISIEESLLKIFCKYQVGKALIPDEVLEDLKKLTGHMYGIWKIGKKYGQKAMAFFEKQYNEIENNEIIDVETDNN